MGEKLSWRKYAAFSYATGCGRWHLRINRIHDGRWYLNWSLSEDGLNDGVPYASLAEAKREAQLLAARMQRPEFLRQYGFQPEDL